MYYDFGCTSDITYYRGCPLCKLGLQNSTHSTPVQQVEQRSWRSYAWGRNNIMPRDVPMVTQCLCKTLRVGVCTVCVREQEQLLEIQGMCWHAQNTHTLIEQLIHSLSHTLTSTHSQKQTTNFICRVGLLSSMIIMTKYHRQRTFISWRKRDAM